MPPIPEGDNLFYLIIPAVLLVSFLLARLAMRQTDTSLFRQKGPFGKAAEESKQNAENEKRPGEC